MTPCSGSPSKLLQKLSPRGRPSRGSTSSPHESSVHTQLGCSPQVPTSLHSRGPQLSPDQMLTLGLHLHLGSNESGVLQLLRTEESPLPGGSSTHPWGAQRGPERAPRTWGWHTRVPGDGTGSQQRLGIWGRCQWEAWAGLRRRRCPGHLLLSGERRVELMINTSMPPACIPAAPTWRPPPSTRAGFLSTKLHSLHATPLLHNPNHCRLSKVKILHPNF